MNFKLLLLLILTITLGTLTQAQDRAVINGPAGSSDFGEFIHILPNGNFVVSDPDFSRQTPTFLSGTGAVYLFNGQTGEMISRIIGSHIGDRVGEGGITILSTGKFVISSPFWGFDDEADVGAVTLCDMNAGCSGEVSRSNSITGVTPNDYVGSVTALTNGNYVIGSKSFDRNGTVDVGAVTFCDGSNTGCTGTVSEANSLIGNNAGDEISIYCEIGCKNGIVPLSNGNYVVSSPHWNSNRGAVTFGDGTNGTTGTISSTNSLVGTVANEYIGIGDRSEIGVYPLPNSNYVVTSATWNSSRGAATFCSAIMLCRGSLSSSNSLVGQNVNDAIGLNGVEILDNNNYLVMSSNWNGRRGAVTFGNGVNGISGSVSSSNSVVGTTADDRVGNGFVTKLDNNNFLITSTNWFFSRGAVTFGDSKVGVTGEISGSNSLIGTFPGSEVGGGGIDILTSGNFVINSPKWTRVGAVTWGNKDTGIIGEIDKSNSLIGDTFDDFMSNSVIPLSNGHYAISNPYWDSDTSADVGAVTLCNNLKGCVGILAESDSLIGTQGVGNIGSGGIHPLKNGNFVVVSKSWDDDRGAVTLVDGQTGLTGTLTTENSLFGTDEDDEIGSGGVFALANGDYVIRSTHWNSARGAVTKADGVSGITGEISSANSLVGNNPSDFVGFDARLGVYSLPNGKFLVKSQQWNNGNIHNAGAVTIGDENTDLIGSITPENSIVGLSSNGGNSFEHHYDETLEQIIVGYEWENKIFIVPTPLTKSIKPMLDFDGDGKTDVSIFRPNAGQWWYLRSSDFGNAAFAFGTNTDTLVPADYTGDGKTDVAFWRESTGEWFILRSEDSSFFGFPFGTSGDIPAPGDFDGDGIADAAVFRPSTATWFIQRSSDGGTIIQGFGISEDKPTVADFDGDGKDDIAIYRPSVSQWWQFRSRDGTIAYQFGTAGDKTIQGDYTGDGKADVGVFRPSTGQWLILRSEDSSFFGFPFGTSTDIPSPGDYDGDGTFDAAVFRPSTNTWFYNGSTSGNVQLNFGISGDIPIPNVYSVE